MAKREKTEAETLAEALTAKERKFVRELLVDLNGTRAAIRTGYAEKSAATQASRLLRKPEVRAYRDALLKEQFEAIGVTHHSIAAEVWKLYLRCTTARPVMEWDSESHEYVETGLWQFDSKGAMKALEMLEKMLPKEEIGDSEEPSFEDTLDGGGDAGRSY